MNDLQIRAGHWTSGHQLALGCVSFLVSFCSYSLKNSKFRKSNFSCSYLDYTCLVINIVEIYV